jgi:hypothetical protein
VILSLVAACLVDAGEPSREPHAFFGTTIGFRPDDIARIDRGQAVAKALSSPSPAEIYVFGAVHVNAHPDAYVEFALDMERLRRMPEYLDARRLSDAPEAAELEGFTLEPDDLRALERCRPGDCRVQMPLELAETFRRGTVPFAQELLRRYRREGNAALGTYHDHRRPVAVTEAFQSLIAGADLLPASLRELHDYLLHYPAVTLPGADVTFAWEKVDFGLKTTIRLNHLIVYRPDHGPVTHVVAVKQLYASHYFQVALDVTACVRDTGPGATPGFYLVSLKASRQEGLTGLRGSIARRFIVGRTRGAQERILANTRAALERARTPPRAPASGPAGFR